ncbi:MAG: hypothetical protein GW856_13450 [Cyanobacteria bacterium]|nr:hypothetical protein [Cyanobacteria bacterium CG_2015-16_32_12]NCO78951.1 hypothetical protein [Cyanobacteria bacterium CG_2015-22_32_23]NCQ03078.1 hypothetical protein [Cyanobacteria bacterium CG_2015-09_32_10]NCS83737.1 hypothetical protein [Cyanobacteria bacterium CG_2015-02_32_10]
MNNILINSQYKVIETLANFQDKKVYLTENIKNNHQQCIVRQYVLNSFTSNLIHTFIKSRQDIHDFCQKNNYHFFPNLQDVIFLENEIILVEDFIQSISLKELIDDDKIWLESEAIKNLKLLLNSLNILHNYNYIHQNINLKSIVQLSSNSEELFITDLDIYFNDESNLMMTVMVEDKLYLPLEKIRGKSFPSSDIYSLGMVIISMIIGKIIFELEEDDHGKIIWENQVNLNEKLVLILNKMIIQESTKRYQNINDVLTDINLFFPEFNSNNQYMPTEIILPDYSNFEDTKNQHQTNINSSISNDSPNFIFDTEISLKVDEKLENNKFTATEILNNLKYSSNLPKNNLQNTIENTILKQNLAFDIFTHIKTPKNMIISLFVTLIFISSTAFLKNYLSTRHINNIITSLKEYHTNKKYDDCITLINSNDVQSLSISNQITEEFLGKCWLGLAEIEASKNNFSQAIAIAVKITPDSKDYQKSLKYIDDWSIKIIKEAKDLYENQNNLPLALEKLQKIPQSSPRKKESLDLAQKWTNQTEENPVIILCPGPLCPQ